MLFEMRIGVHIHRKDDKYELDLNVPINIYIIICYAFKENYKNTNLIGVQKADPRTVPIFFMSTNDLQHIELSFKRSIRHYL